MEKSKSISPKEFIKGFYIEMQCCMCNIEVSFGASTKKDLKVMLDEAGWKELNSDMYQVIGHHCGCDYRD